MSSCLLRVWKEGQRVSRERSRLARCRVRGGPHAIGGAAAVGRCCHATCWPLGNQTLECYSAYKSALPLFHPNTVP